MGSPNKNKTMFHPVMLLGKLKKFVDWRQKKSPHKIIRIDPFILFELIMN